MLSPQSMAIVGASDRQPAMRAIVDQNAAHGTRMHLVNPNRDDVLGLKAYRSLADIPEPVDTVLSVVNAELTVDVVRTAAAIGARAVVITAAGFGETDEAGKQRQREIVDIAAEHEMAICGPNCNGVVNVAAGKSLCTRPVDGIRRGGVALISQSGGLVSAIVTAAGERHIGFSHLISSGNEARTDLVDYLEVLVDDPEVTTVMMVIEQIRRPQEFIDVAYRARAAGKALIALKLGRSAAGQRMGASHTGAMMGDARDYDAYFRQLGVLIADDLDDLLGLTQLFSSLPPSLWRPGDSVGVLCASGGSASLMSDAFDQVGLPLPVDPALADWMQQLIPTNALGNPFDTTGLLYNEQAFEDVLEHYLQSDIYDTIFVVSSMLGPDSEPFCAPIAGPIRRAAERKTKRLILASSPVSQLGAWTGSFIDSGAGLGSGIAPTVRSLKAMDRFARTRSRARPQSIAPMLRPAQLNATKDGDSLLLGYTEAAQLARQFGVPIAPFVEVDPATGDVASALDALPLSDHYVVKVANSLHRSDIGGVATGVLRHDLLAEIDRISAVATAHDLPSGVLIQPQLAGLGEVLLGAQNASALGPIVAFGLGGIFVEALADISARLAPFDIADATDLLDEIRGRAMMDGLRGQAPWDRTMLAEIVVRFGTMAAATAGWLESIDINPLIVTHDGYLAVDISCIVAPHE
jgi:acyl-CoA synthetase (NDP forming)